ncbi:energy-coupling factor transporter transmembrane component T [Salinicola sp. MIT1003]|uniref:energy-coupling factor transporter transmembrane component T family protein n=1 Tax=Salinicola sp. MIT1003 TaxID=1882734 RepID=UPI0008DC9CB0|nr:energy-coupling factor transporter transmembrane component T [Salinicola sp. MIT1003]OHZ01624.1 cobalt transport protein [Salinicola sp. MIT1003]
MLYKRGNTIFHRADPRVKILMVVVVLALALTTTRIDALVTLTVSVIVGLCIFASLTPKKYWRAIALVVPLIILLTLLQSLLQPGDPLFKIGSVDFSESGIMLGLGIGIRLLAMGICFYGFSVTTSPSDISLALHKMGVPYKFAYLTSFAFRFLPLMQDEARTLLTAMAVRGSSDGASANPVRRGKAIVRMLFPMLVGSMKRSGEISLSMALRGYELRGTRTYYRALKLRVSDCIFILGVVLIAAAIIALQVYFNEPIIGA